MTNSIKRNFSIKDKAFEGIQSSSEVTMVGRRMIPDDLLELLDDDCQVRDFPFRVSSARIPYHLSTSHSSLYRSIREKVLSKFSVVWFTPS